MRERIQGSWGRDPVGFRHGDLTAADGVATSAVVMVGGPALIVGARLVAEQNLGLGQILLVAPLAALVGGLVIGASARMAASTGANSAYLLRPTFGTLGARLIALLRMVLVGVWAIAGLQMVGGWGAEAAQRVGAGGGEVIETATIVAVAAIGLVMALAGVSATVKVALRRPLFWASVALLAIVAWQLAPGTGAAVGDGPFWSATQRAIEMSVVFVPYIQAVARRLEDDEEAATSFGVGYMVPGTLMLMAGAVFADIAGGLPTDLSVFISGTAGAVLAIGWVVVAEVDQSFAAFVGTGSELVGVLAVVPEAVLGVVAAVVVTGVAILLSGTVFGLSALLAALAFPAVLIMVTDFFLTHDRYYTQSELEESGDEAKTWNVVGMGCWLLAIILGQLLDPVGPSSWLEAVPDVGLGGDVPWRLLMDLVGAIAYFVLVRWQGRRPADVYDLRGVDHTVTNRP